MVAVHGFILFSVDVYLWSNSAELSLLTLSPFWQEVVGGLDETLIVQLEASFVVPVLIWMLVTVRMEDLKAWRSAGASGPSGRGGAKSN